MTANRRSPWEEVPATIESVGPLGEHLIRLVVVGPLVRDLRDDGPDQRLKIVLPDGAGLRALTISELDTSAGRLTMLIVRHEPAGALGRWLAAAQPGDDIVLSAATTRSTDVPAGVDWCPPIDLDELLVVADASALPAVARILVGLDERVTGTVMVCVRSMEESIALPRPPGVRLEWFLGGEEEWISRNVAARLGELPLPRSTRRFYAWVACESGLVKVVRKHLLDVRRLPRECVSLSGYWRRDQVAA
jgi:NADPH-dependent ferric siderophore reductase